MTQIILISEFAFYMAQCECLGKNGSTCKYYLSTASAYPAVHHIQVGQSDVSEYYQCVTFPPMCTITVVGIPSLASQS